MKKSILSLSLVLVMISAMVTPAFAANPTVSTSMSGNNVTITVSDGSVKVSGVVAYAKNTTQTYDVGAYKVQITYNGSGVKSAAIVGSAAPSDNTPAPKPGQAVNGGDMTWNKADEQAAKVFTQSASKDKAPPATALVPVVSGRTDASGDKISSNAHSGDYPGIYFYWNDKQKDDGILKVDPSIFDAFKDGKFYITAKNSNAYWDYWILPGKGVPTSEGYLLYQIPRYFMDNKNKSDELKNINMIFVGGDYKDAWLTIDKDWFDEEGNPIIDAARITELNKLLSFNGGTLNLGLNKIEITDWTTAFKGKTVTVTEGSIPGFTVKKNPLSATVKGSDSPVKSVKFENQKQWAYIKIDKTWDLLPGSVAPGAKFIIYSVDENLLYGIVDPGTYKVKEGTYKIAEIDISGFTADKADATVKVAAGKTETVSFKNKEDRATVEIIKNWIGDDLPDGVAATLTNGYKFNDKKTIKAGTNVAFMENEIDAIVTDDGFIYTFDFVGVEIPVLSIDSKTNAVNFIAAKDVDYVIIITNKVTKAPLPADLTIVKIWQDEKGNPLNKTGLFATVDNDIVFTAPYTLGLNKNVALDLDLSTIDEDLNKCKYEDDQYWYSFEQFSVVGNSGVVAPGKTYTITFTNKLVKTAKPAKVIIVKNWLDDKGNPLSKTGVFAKVDADISFSDFKLGDNLNIPAGKNYNVTEDLSKCKYEDNQYWYSFVQSDVTGNVFTTAPGGTHTVTFTNKLIKTAKPAKVIIVKKWLDDKGNPLSKTGVFATVDADISFSDFKLGENLNIPVDKIYNVTEDISKCNYEDNQFWYSFVQSDVTGNVFTTAPGGTYTVTFTNRLIKTAKPAKVIIEKKWLDDKGNPLSKTGVFATVDADISFSDFKLGDNLNIPAGKNYNVTENLSKCNYEDDQYLYSFEQVSVVGNIFTTAPGGTHTVTFTNELIKTAKPAKVIIEKKWLDENGDPLSKTGVFATVDADISFSDFKLGDNLNIPAGKNYNVTEDLSKCNYYDDQYLYSFVQVSVVGNVFTTAPGGTHTVIFTNKLIKTAKTAKVIIVKNWLDENGYPLSKTGVFANVDNDISFPGFKLGENLNVPAGQNYNITEDLSKCNYYDDQYLYSFVQVSVVGNIFTSAPGGTHTVTFTNKLIKTAKSAKVIIVKNWLDENGNPLSKTGVFATVDNDISFPGFKLGENLNVPAGQNYNITEDLSKCNYYDDQYLYSFVQFSVVGNIFTSAPGGTHTVTFTNKLIKTAKPAKVIIVKNWLDENGNPLSKTGVFATVDADISFSGFKLGENLNVPAGQGYNVTEDLSKCLYEDSEYRYSFEPVGVVVGGTFTTTPGGTHTVTFTNKLIKTAKPAKVIIEKRWFKGMEEVSGGTVSFTNGYVLGENTVNADVKVNFTEDMIVLGSDWMLIDITVDGEPVDMLKGVDFVAKAGKTYKIVFTNWQPAEPTGTLYIDKNVDGEIIADWTVPAGYDIEDLILGFHLYGAKTGVGGLEVDYDNEIDFVNITDVLDNMGTIIFEHVKAGVYAVVEELTADGKDVFASPPPLFVEFNGVTVVGGDDVFYVSDSTVGVIVGNVAGTVFELPSTWNNALRGAGYGDKLDALEAMGAKWIWDDADTYQYGDTGSVAEFRVKVDVDADVTTPFYFSADNAAIVYVNGKLAGYTQVSLRNALNLGDPYDSDVFKDLSYTYFDGGWEGGWTHAYEITIDLKEGSNEIIVVAANSKHTDYPPNDVYNTLNNPCGVIFGFAVPSDRVVFENVTDDTFVPTAALEIQKLVEGIDIETWFGGSVDIEDYIKGFELYKIVGGARVGGPITTGNWMSGGIYKFDKLELGEYEVVEVLTDLGKKLFDDSVTIGNIILTLAGTTVKVDFENTVIPDTNPGYPGAPKIPSHSHVANWASYGIYALAGNTMDSPNGDYFVAFTKDFFDKYEEVTIVYGSNPDPGSAVLVLTLTKDDCNFTTGFTFSGGGGHVPAGDYYVYWFDNPHGTGARHAYLYKLI